MKPLLLIVILTFLFQANSCGQSVKSQSKRAAPKDLAPVYYQGKTFERSGMEFVQAVDSASKKILWKKNIYSVSYTPGLETDVQDVFIDSMYIRNKHLLIRNEEQKWFDLDLETLKVIKF